MRNYMYCLIVNHSKHSFKAQRTAKGEGLVKFLHRNLIEPATIIVRQKETNSKKHRTIKLHVQKHVCNTHTDRYRILGGAAGKKHIKNEKKNTGTDKKSN